MLLHTLGLPVPFSHWDLGHMLGFAIVVVVPLALAVYQMIWGRGRSTDSD